jgi:hypothetical protein
MQPDWTHGSSGRVPALQAWSPEFKHKSCQKRAQSTCLVGLYFLKAVLTFVFTRNIGRLRRCKYALGKDTRQLTPRLSPAFGRLQVMGWGLPSGFLGETEVQKIKFPQSPSKQQGLRFKGRSVWSHALPSCCGSLTSQSDKLGKEGWDCLSLIEHVR